MSHDRGGIAARCQQTIRRTTAPYRTLASRFRDGIVATLTLTALLVAVFQVELLLAQLLGYESPASLLASSATGVKTLVAATVGPFVHVDGTHLLGNLGVLLVLGTYLEYEYDRRSLYAVALGVGYLSAWAPILLGSTGAVGASGVTYGLTGWLLVHAASRVVEMADDASVDGRLFHVAFVCFGLFELSSLYVVFRVVNGAADVTHVFGATLGLGVGLYVVLEHHDADVDRMSTP